MPITDDIRKTITDATPFYFAAGVVDKIREEAPERIAAVRATDPKEFQAKVSQQAKETQAKVTEALGMLDADLKKLREQAQSLALQGVGVAAEYVVRARETYDQLAERGRDVVKSRRGDETEGTTQVTVEREPVKVAEPPVDEPATTGNGSATGTTTSAATGTDTGTATTSSGDATGAAEAGPGAAKKTTARRTTTRKTTPKSES